MNIANYSQNDDGRLKARVKNVMSALGCKCAADIQEWALNSTSGQSFLLLERVINSPGGKWLEKVINSTEEKFGFTVTGAEDTI